MHEFGELQDLLVADMNLITTSKPSTPHSRKSGLHARNISEVAGKVHFDIVKKVFNASLNKIWRDLFVRLAHQNKSRRRFDFRLATAAKSRLCS